MMRSQLSFLAGVARWSLDHPGMEFIGHADGRSVRFVITDEALTILGGGRAGGPEHHFDTFFEHEAVVHRAAAAVFRARRGAGPALVITPHELLAA